MQTAGVRRAEWQADMAEPPADNISEMDSMCAEVEQGLWDDAQKLAWLHDMPLELGARMVAYSACDSETIRARMAVGIAEQLLKHMRESSQPWITEQAKKRIADGPDVCGEMPW